MGAPVASIAAPTVTCSGVAKEFTARRGSVHALDGADLTLRPGTVTALVGPSGCGKSTLLRIIAGLETATRGSVSVDGDAPARLRKRGEISVAFQDASLLPWRSVRSNVALALKLARRP